MMMMRSFSFRYANKLLLLILRLQARVEYMRCVVATSGVGSVCVDCNNGAMIAFATIVSCIFVVVVIFGIILNTIALVRCNNNRSYTIIRHHIALLRLATLTDTIGLFGVLMMFLLQLNIFDEHKQQQSIIVMNWFCKVSVSYLNQSSHHVDRYSSSLSNRRTHSASIVCSH